MYDHIYSYSGTLVIVFNYEIQKSTEIVGMCCENNFIVK